jgi:hypothetical protein
MDQEQGLQSRYRRLAARTSAFKALVAVEHAIITAIWHILTTGTDYRALGADYYQCRDPTKRFAESSNKPTRSGSPSASTPSPKPPPDQREQGGFRSVSRRTHGATQSARGGGPKGAAQAAGTQNHGCRATRDDARPSLHTTVAASAGSAISAGKPINPSPSGPQSGMSNQAVENGLSCADQPTGEEANGCRPP